VTVRPRDRGDARRIVAPPADPLVAGERFDYVDAFEIDLAAADDRTPERFARDALERAPAAVRRIIWVAQRHILRFDLAAPDAPGHVLGMRVTASDAEIVRLETGSSITRAVLVGRRHGPDRFVLTTHLTHGRRRAARLLWAVVGPVHRRIARVLLERAVYVPDP
jgi:hypothetical protein